MKNEKLVIIEKEYMRIGHFYTNERFIIDVDYEDKNIEENIEEGIMNTNIAEVNCS